MKIRGLEVEEACIKPCSPKSRVSGPGQYYHLMPADIPRC